MVTVGTRVTWTNHDATAHTATANGGGFDTKTVAPKASRTIDFKHPGTFTYHRAFHAFMTATITVKRRWDRRRRIDGLGCSRPRWSRSMPEFTFSSTSTS